MGKQVYLNDKQLELIKLVLAPGNFSKESGTDEEIEEVYRLRDEILLKVSK